VRAARSLLVVAAAALVGCGGSGSGGRSTPTPDPTFSRHGGLVGAIDAARVVAVCTNVGIADTAATAGATDAEDQALDAATDVLRQGAAGPAERALATRWTGLRERVGDAAVIRSMQSWCDANGG
jgi:hypothetical protein